MSRLAFLTGATGYIGGKVAAALARDGWRLRCLVRDEGRAAALVELRAELVTGDITDDAALADGLRGADAACHLAAAYEVGPVDGRVFERTNVEGTRRFLRAFETAGTPHGVYVSSTAALAPAAAGSPGASGAHSGPYPSLYHRTKAEAHRLALQAQARGAPLAIACPASVYGPGDEGPHGRFIADLVAGRVPALLREPAWFCYVYIDDAAAGIVAALERGRAGATYIFAGEPATVNDFALHVRRIAGHTRALPKLPTGMLRLVGAAQDAFARVTGARFAISRESIDISSRHNWVHDDAPTRHELDWRPRPLAAGLPETVAWFRARRTGRRSG